MKRDRAKKQTGRQRKEAMKKLFFSNTFRLVLISAVLLFGLFNVIQITRVSTTGFTISDLEKQKNSLENETQRLEVKIAEFGSMKRIQESLSELNMVPAEDVEYIHVPGTTVVKR